MIDNRTPHLNLPLPDRQNLLKDDVERLKQALTGVDNFAAKVDLTIATLGTAAARNVGTESSDVPDTQLLNARLGTTGNLGTAATKSVGAGNADLPDNNQLNVRLGTNANLGNAALKTVQSSPSDSTADRLLAAGAGGLLGSTINLGDGANLDNPIWGSVGQTNTAGAKPASWPPVGDGPKWLVVESWGSSARGLQKATQIYNVGGEQNRSFWRSVHDNIWSPWRDDYGFVVSFAGLNQNPNGYTKLGGYNGQFTINGSNRSGFLEVVGYSSSGDTVAQRFCDWDNFASYTRFLRNGSWQPWKETSYISDSGIKGQRVTGTVTLTKLARHSVFTNFAVVNSTVTLNSSTFSAEDTVEIIKARQAGQLDFRASSGNIIMPDGTTDNSPFVPAGKIGTVKIRFDGVNWEAFY